MNQDRLKSSVAEAAINYIESELYSDSILGVGTGSTANFFIDYLFFKWTFSFVFLNSFFHRLFDGIRSN